MSTYIFQKFPMPPGINSSIPQGLRKCGQMRYQKSSWELSNLPLMLPWIFVSLTRTVFTFISMLNLKILMPNVVHYLILKL